MVEIYNGDSFEYLKNRHGKRRISLFCEDPPYFKTNRNFDKTLNGKTIDYSDSSQVRLVENYIDNYIAVRREVATPDAVFVITSAEPFTSVLRYRLLKYRVDSFVWEKANITNPLAINKKIGNAHEDVSVFSLSKQYTFNKQVTKVGKPYKAFKTKTAKIIGEVVGGAKSMHNENTGTRTEKSVQRQFLEGSEHLSKILQSYPEIMPVFQAFMQYIDDNVDLQDLDVLENSIQLFTREYGLHKTQKPVGLMERAIRWFSNEGDLVFDGYMGSGTTGIACLRSKRDFIGVEIDENYFDIAQKRINQEIENLNLYATTT